MCAQRFEPTCGKSLTLLRNIIDQTQVTKMHRDKKTPSYWQQLKNVLHSENYFTYPVLAELQSMIVDKQLAEFDASFLNNWVHKKAKGHTWRAEQESH